MVEVATAISRRTGSRELAQRAVDALENLPDLRLINMDSKVVQTAIRVGIEITSLKPPCTRRAEKGEINCNDFHIAKLPHVPYNIVRNQDGGARW